MIALDCPIFPAGALQGIPGRGDSYTQPLREARRIMDKASADLTKATAAVREIAECYDIGSTAENDIEANFSEIEDPAWFQRHALWIREEINDSEEAEIAGCIPEIDEIAWKPLRKFCQALDAYAEALTYLARVEKQALTASRP